MFRAGHSIMEDVPKEVAKSCHDMLRIFKIPANTEDKAKLKELGIGKFKPDLPDYN